MRCALPRWQEHENWAQECDQHSRHRDHVEAGKGQGESWQKRASLHLNEHRDLSRLCSGRRSTSEEDVWPHLASQWRHHQGASLCGMGRQAARQKRDGRVCTQKPPESRRHHQWTSPELAAGDRQEQVCPGRLEVEPKHSGPSALARRVRHPAAPLFPALVSIPALVSYHRFVCLRACGRASSMSQA
jgi:hypothetical protein